MNNTKWVLVHLLAMAACLVLIVTSTTVLAFGIAASFGFVPFTFSAATLTILYIAVLLRVANPNLAVLHEGSGFVTSLLIIAILLGSALIGALSSELSIGRSIALGSLLLIAVVVSGSVLRTQGSRFGT